MLFTAIGLVIASIISFYIGRYIGKNAKFDPKDANAIGKRITNLVFSSGTLIFVSFFVGIKFPVVFFAIPILIGVIGFNQGKFDSVSSHPNVHTYY